MTKTFRVSANYECPFHYEGREVVHEHHPERPQDIVADLVVPTVAEAEALVAEFPKSVKLRACQYGTDREARGMVIFGAVLSGNGVNGGVNETGLRRYRTFRKHADRLGFTIEWAQHRAMNGYQTEGEFEEAVR